MSIKKKKIFGPLEITIFIAAIGLLAYIGLKSGGGSIIEKTESLEITNNPKGSAEPKIRKDQPSEDESVEAVLRQISDQFSGETGDYQEQKKKEKEVMSADERAFLEEVKEKNPDKDSTTDWFSILRASHKTYTKVKSAFESAGIDVKAAENLTSSLANEVAAKAVYSKLEETFGIPEKEAKAFAEKGEKALSDWAWFVEEKSQ